jgi:large subunit ribosomal protein L5
MVIMSFKDYYTKEIQPKLMKELNIDNVFALPKVKKIVINVGVGEAAINKSVLEKVKEGLSFITGQKAISTLAKKSISAFKIRRGVPIGAKVTLRGKRMADFLEKLIKIVLPRVKDFRGISSKNLDGGGNLNLGISEQTLFPEISYDRIDKIRGLQITITTNAKDNQKGKKLFEALGIPFQRAK